MSEISRKSLILSVNQKYGNIIISWLRDQNLIDSEFKINSSQSILYIPIKFIPKGYKEKKISIIWNYIRWIQWKFNNMLKNGEKRKKIP